MHVQPKVLVLAMLGLVAGEERPAGDFDEPFAGFDAVFTEGFKHIDFLPLDGKGRGRMSMDLVADGDWVRHTQGTIGMPSEQAPLFLANRKGVFAMDNANLAALYQQAVGAEVWVYFIGVAGASASSRTYSLKAVSN